MIYLILFPLAQNCRAVMGRDGNSFGPDKSMHESLKPVGSPRRPTRIGLDEFSHRRGLWRLEWIGGLRPRVQFAGEFVLQVGLRGPAGKFHRTWVPFSDAPYLLLGSLWEDGHLVGLSGLRYRFLVPELDPGFRIETLGDDSDPREREFELQGLRLAPTNDPSGVSRFRTAGPVDLLVPDWIWLKHFYAFTPRLAMAAFFGSLEATRAVRLHSPFLPYSPMGTRRFPRDGELAVLSKRKHLQDDEAKQYSRILFHPRGAATMDRLARLSTLSNGRTGRNVNALPKIDPPLSGPVRLEVRGMVLPVKHDGRYQMLVLGIEELTAPLPYRKLFLRRANDNRRGETQAEVLKPAFGGDRLVTSGVAPTLLIDSVEQDPRFERQEIDGFAMRDTTAHHSPILESRKRRQEYRSASRQIELGPASSVGHGLRNVRGSEVPPGAPHSREEKAGLLDTEQAPSEVLDAAKMRALQVAIASVGKLHPQASARLRHPEPSCLVLRAVRSQGRLKPLYFYVGQFTVLGKCVDAIELLTQSDTTTHPLVLVATANRDPLDESTLFTIFSLIHRARKSGRSISTFQSSATAAEHLRVARLDSLAVPHFNLRSKRKSAHAVGTADSESPPHDKFVQRLLLSIGELINGA